VSGAADAVVFVTSRSFGQGDQGVREQLEDAVAEVRYNELGRPLTSAELAAALGDVDGVILGVDEADAAALASGGSRLRVLARYGVATDNVDLEAAARAGVAVTHTPGANADAVAELAIGLMLALARSIPEADRLVRGGAWPSLRGRQVSGATVGLLGLGQVGRAVARRALALGCEVVAHDPAADRATAGTLGVAIAPEESVVEAADFLSLHLPLTPETRDMVDASLLDRMRHGSFLVNTARGELVVEADLVRALDEGRLAGAALDTFRHEPPPEGHPLVGRDDVIVTPHMGAHTDEAATAMGRAAVADLLAVLDGRPPRHPVKGIGDGG
jgi:D-3-phosphoglycerate dehydrogenase / 2-oxoglutarate reductase